MITFGFKTRTNNYLRAIAGIALGVVVLITCLQKIDPFAVLVKIVAAFVVAAGIFSLIYGLIKRDEKDFTLLMVNAVVDIVLGVIFFIFASSIAKIFFWAIAAVLIIFAVWEMIALLSARKFVKTGWMYLLPFAVILFAILLMAPNITKGWMCAIALILFGVSELMAALKMKKAIKLSEDEKETDNVDVPYVEAEKVEEAAPAVEAKEEEKA